uniref:Cadherin domain-containing protein n=1 Tax=Pundamilia nyererei TaxID=303518 RepID=A0A3B4GSI7_9CICH
MSGRTMRWQVLLFVSVSSLGTVFGQVAYSIPEEMSKGSVVGNIAQDLGINVKRLKSGKARIYTEDNGKYVELNKDRGVLLVRERIDRETLCGQTTPCALHLQITLEDPIEFYTVTVEINDINDNAPSFKKDEIKFRISESAVTGAKFVLERAMDPDVGVNGLQSYSLQPTDSFNLKLQNQQDGSKKVEMVLQKHLDREAQQHLSLILTAADGGEPQLSGTMILENPMELFRITIEITDINDNAPSFASSEKRFEISESAIIGSKFVLEKAIDADIGTNGLQSYSLNPTNNFALKLENQADGSKKVEMILQKPLDREQDQHILLLLTALDGGQPRMSGTMQITVNVLDANDNAPVFTKPVYKATITENSPAGTSVITVRASDKDGGSNGEISYAISNSKRRLSDLFQIDRKTGEVIVIGQIDYEKTKLFQIDIEATDNGGLSDSSKILLDVTDVNDNSPQLKILSKSDAILEDSPESTVIAMLSVNDPDSDRNGEFGRAGSQNVLIMDPSSTGTMQRIQSEKSILDEPDSPLEVRINITSQMAQYIFITCYFS